MEKEFKLPVLSKTAQVKAKVAAFFSKKKPEPLPPIQPQVQPQAPKLPYRTLSKSPEALHLSLHTPISPLSGLLTPNSSDQSDLSGPSDLSSPMGSPLPMSSPEEVGSPLSQTLSPGTIEEMLHTSPAIEPVKKKRSSDEFVLPVAAVTKSKPAHRPRSPSMEVNIDSDRWRLPESEDIIVAQWAAVLQGKEDPIVEIDDDGDGGEGELNFLVDTRAVTSKFPAKITDPTPTPVIVSEQWTPLMHAAWNGDLKAIQSMNFTFKDVKKRHAYQPGFEGICALALVRGGRDVMHELLDKNPIAYLEQYNENFCELIEQDLKNNELSDELLKLLVDLHQSLYKSFSESEKDRQYVKLDTYKNSIIKYDATGWGKLADLKEISEEVTILEAALTNIGKITKSIDGLRKLYKEYQTCVVALPEYDEILKIFAQKARE